MQHGLRGRLLASTSRTANTALTQAQFGHFALDVEGLLMEQIRDQDEDMATQIQDLMFVFENLVEVDDQGIQKLLRDVPQDVLQKALKGADDSLREKVFKNMSKRAAEMMRDDIEAMPPVRVADVEAAQKEILAIARRMADAGELMLSGGADEFL